MQHQRPFPLAPAHADIDYTCPNCGSKTGCRCLIVEAPSIAEVPAHLMGETQDYPPTQIRPVPPANDLPKIWPVAPTHPIPVALTPESTMAALREMDPWRVWDIKLSLRCDAGLEEDVYPSLRIATLTPYNGATTNEKWEGCQRFEGATLEECLAQARAAFVRDLDAQLVVLTENHLESADELWKVAETLRKDHSRPFHERVLTEDSTPEIERYFLKETRWLHLHRRAMELHDNLMEQRQADYNARGDKDNEVREGK